MPLSQFVESMRPNRPLRVPGTAPVVKVVKVEPKPLTTANKPLRPPFLRGDDSGGYGPNASSRDDFDIPTVLRRQMD